MAKCPVCETGIPDPIPPLCDDCGWSFENDPTLRISLDRIPERTMETYRRQLGIAKRNWSRQIELERKLREQEASGRQRIDELERRLQEQAASQRQPEESRQEEAELDEAGKITTRANGDASSTVIPEDRPRAGQLDDLNALVGELARRLSGTSRPPAKAEITQKDRERAVMLRFGPIVEYLTNVVGGRIKKRDTVWLVRMGTTNAVAITCVFESNRIVLSRGTLTHHIYGLFDPPNRLVAEGTPEYASVSRAIAKGIVKLIP